ncbi:MAG TPA: pyridoxamine 5'-phosphate oxidase family protein [Acidimicrobiales bacterium]|nr:pyridoxamine 5'-phosphate oxidase family protein [Acidimicrobiales bacterium]
MTYDQRGSDVLTEEECRSILRHAGEAGFTGHLGIGRDGPPHVIPVNFTFFAAEVLIRLGSGYSAFHLDGARVSFEVDASEPYGRKGWSVVVEGTARQVPYEEATRLGRNLPRPVVMLQGMRVFAICPNSISGRRLRHDHESDNAGAPSSSGRDWRTDGELRTWPSGGNEGEGRSLVDLHLDNAEARELHQLLSEALGELSTEIASTDNPAYLRTLRQRRIHLERIERELGSLAVG